MAGKAMAGASESAAGSEASLQDHAGVAHYLCQLNALILTRHLALLMIEAQRHRGASMGVLAGNREFRSRVSQSQAVIQRYLAVVEQLNVQGGELIQPQQWLGIKRDWRALTDQWQSDAVMTNFEFHNHFIDSLLRLIWEIVSEARLVDAGGPDEGIARMVQNITLKLMPELLEDIARVRGLATHVCSLGGSQPEFDSRLVSLMHALSMNKEKLRIVSRALQHDTLRAVPTLPEILLHDHKLDQLQQTVNTRVNGATRIQVNSAELFEFATDVIDTYAQVIHDGVTFFRRRIERRLGCV